MMIAWLVATSLQLVELMGEEERPEHLPDQVDGGGGAEIPKLHVGSGRHRIDWAMRLYSRGFKGRRRVWCVW